MRVLLVEDDVSLSSFIEKGLREAGHQVELVDNGKHALTLCMTEQVVETHISRLRNKLEKPFGDRLIQTVRGAGYKLEHKALEQSGKGWSFSGPPHSTRHAGPHRAVQR
ncbi:response regulator transcription factor [Endozoicomonas sp. ALE010]|uniref:response regulator transcription factor n=1 Tax=Endozoicomonas sp. ALE010 TaxID=3403081 RepID=UPI003BB67F00